MANPLVLENVWLQQQKFEDAHTLYQQLKAGTAGGAAQKASGTLASEIAAVRQDIQKALNKSPVSSGSNAGGDGAVYQRLEALEKENKELRKITDDLRALILNVQASVAGGKPAAPAAAPAKPAPADDESDDDLDDDDLFGGSDDEEAAAIKAKRLEEYAAKKAKKPTVIAKSNVILDVKPWDDETDMAELEKCVRKIEMDGLIWGTSSLVEVGYGIKKLRITTVVEDAKVSIEELSERICDENEDHCQSVDIAAFNKI